ncbi:hypothetical protein ACFLQJ_03255, partial [Calditrichota bacterium]
MVIHATDVAQASAQQALLTEEQIQNTTAILPVKKDTLILDKLTVRQSDEIESLPVNNIREVIWLTPGVNYGHFHGGYGDDVNFQVDGVSYFSPSSGFTQTYIPRLAYDRIQTINNYSSVKFGNNLSGTIIQSTRSGNEQFTGALDFRTNDLGSTFIGERDQMKDVQGRISGKVPGFDRFNRGTMYYLLSGQYFDTDGRFENDDSTLTSAFGKITYRITPNHRLSFSSAISNSQYTHFAQGDDENLWSGTTYEDKLEMFEPLSNPEYIDANGDPWFGNGKVDTEDLNHNGVLDIGEDIDGDGVIDTEDLNHNYKLDSFRMFDHCPYFQQHTERYTINWKHSLSPKTDYEIILSHSKFQQNYNTKERFNEDTNGNGIFDLELKYQNYNDIPEEILNGNYTDPDGNVIPYIDVLKPEFDAQGNPMYYYFDFNRNGVFEYEDVNGNKTWDWKSYGQDHDLFKDENNNGYIDASEGQSRDEWLQWKDINFFGNTKDAKDFYRYGSGKTYSRYRWGVAERDTWNFRGKFSTVIDGYHYINSGVDIFLLDQLGHGVDMGSGGNVYLQTADLQRKIYGFWIEDIMKYNKMILNIGLRFDNKKLNI